MLVTQKDIEVNLEEGVLSIKSKKEDKEETKDGEVIHKGIAKRYFSKSFTIADDVEVKGAELKDGLLKVSMERSYLTIRNQEILRLSNI